MADPLALLQMGQLSPLSPADVGFIPILVLLCFLVVVLVFVAASVYFLTMRPSLLPEYRDSLTMAAVLAVVVAAGYLFLTVRYLGLINVMLSPRQFGFETTFQALRSVALDLSIYRYGLWLVTIPLVTMMFPMLLNLRGRDARLAFTWPPVLAFWMMLSWAIGEQQIGLDGNVNTPARLVWGVIGLVGYAGVIVFVFGFLRGSAIISEPEERRAFRHMSTLLVTTWLVYPGAFLLPVFFPEARLLWIQIMLGAGDAFNFVTPGVVTLLAARRMTYKKIGVGGSR